MNAFLDWKDKENERLKQAWLEIRKAEDAVTGTAAVQRVHFETQITALSDKAARQTEDLVKLGKALEQESLAREALRVERNEAVLEKEKWRLGFEGSEALKSELKLA